MHAYFPPSPPLRQTPTPDSPCGRVTGPRGSGWGWGWGYSYVCSRERQRALCVRSRRPLTFWCSLVVGLGGRRTTQRRYIDRERERRERGGGCSEFFFPGYMIWQLKKRRVGAFAQPVCPSLVVHVPPSSPAPLFFFSVLASKGKKETEADTGPRGTGTELREKNKSKRAIKIITVVVAVNPSLPFPPFPPFPLSRRVYDDEKSSARTSHSVLCFFFVFGKACVWYEPGEIDDRTFLCVFPGDRPYKKQTNAHWEKETREKKTPPPY